MKEKIVRIQLISTGVSKPVLLHLIQFVCHEREPNGKPYPSFEQLAIDSSTGDVDDTYEAIRRSMYDVHLTRWLQYFSLKQFHFLSAENLVANPAEELHKVETFLGLQHKLTKDVFYFNECRGFYCMCVNQRKREAHPSTEVNGTCLELSKGRIVELLSPNI